MSVENRFVTGTVTSRDEVFCHVCKHTVTLEEVVTERGQRVVNCPNCVGECALCGCPLAAAYCFTARTMTEALPPVAGLDSLPVFQPGPVQLEEGAVAEAEVPVRVLVMTMDPEFQRRVAELGVRFASWGHLHGERSLFSLLERLHSTRLQGIVIDESFGFELLDEVIRQVRGLRPELRIAAAVREASWEKALRRAGAHLILLWPEDRARLEDWLWHLLRAGGA